MISCAISKTIKLSNKGLNRLKQYYNLSIYETSEEIENAVEVIVGTPPKQIPNGLKFVQMIAAGFDAVDVDAYKSQGIHIANGSGTTSIAIAEFVVAMLLLKMKRLDTFYEQQKEALWNPITELMEFTDLNIAILGTGHIGYEIARRLEPFGAHITGYNSNGRFIEGFKNTHALTNFKAVVQEYDVVICALPLNDQTYHFINLNILHKMKQDAIIVNVGRGAVIDLEAVIEVMDNKLKYVLLDVFETEPLPQNHPLWKHPKAFITPHISYASNYRNQRIESLIVDNLIRYATGESLRNLITQ